MIFREGDIEKARLFASLNDPATDWSKETPERVAEVLHKDGDRVRQVLDYRRAQSAKQAWRQKRFNFEKGIKRFQRQGGVLRDLRQRLANRFKRYSTAGNFQGGANERLAVDLPEFERYEFLRDIALLEAYAFEEAAVFALPEDYVESVVYAEDLMRACARAKAEIVEGYVGLEPLETLLEAVGREFLGEPFTEEGSLVEAFSKLKADGVPAEAQVSCAGRGDGDESQSDGRASKPAGGRGGRGRAASSRSVRRY